MELDVVSIDQLEEEDLKWLGLAREAQLGGVSPGNLASQVSEGRAQIWRYIGDEDQRGIIITTVLSHNDGKELLVWLLSGIGMKPHLEEITERLSDFGRSIGCKWLTGRSKPAIARLLSRKHGFEVARHEVVKEI
jgi:hypothetical protein